MIVRSGIKVKGEKGLGLEGWYAMFVLLFTGLVAAVKKRLIIVIEILINKDDVNFPYCHEKKVLLKHALE